MRMLRLFWLLVLGAFLHPEAARAIPITLDFEALEHGSVVEAQPGGVGIRAHNPNRAFELAVAFDTTRTGTADPDLQSASGGAQLWSGGNLVGIDLGNILILQENDLGCETSRCSDPDDEGSRPAGELVFHFDVAILSFGLDLVDVESLAAEDGSITFTGGGASATVGFSTLLAGLALGDNTANRIAPLSAEVLGLVAIEEVVVALGGSGGVDNVTFEPVPEPATWLLLGLGAAGALGVRRRGVR